MKGETVPTLVGKRTRTVMAGVLGLVMLFGLTGCGGSSSDSGKRADVTVDSTDRFSPNKLEISVNQADSFTFLNKDKKVHNVTIPAFAIDMDIQPGQRIDVKIPTVATVPRDGFLSFYCKYHQTEGESGRITISK